jgi:polyisoprenoid-binding protein YceI
VHRVVAALAATAAAAAGARAEPATYRLDPDHTFVHFEVLHFGTSTLRGRFGPLDGFVRIDRAALRGEVGLRIAIASLDTGLELLDRRLQEPDLLASAANPEAFFVARDFRFDGERVAEVRGEFTLRGTSQPLALRALRFGCRTDTHEGRPVEVCGGDFEGQAHRSDFGMTFGLPFVADRVRIVVQVEGRRAD